MFDKKFGLILLICITLLCAIATVSATDLNATDEISTLSNDEVAVEDIEDNEILEKTEENTLNDDHKTFTDLNSLINDNENLEINLTSNYAFNKDTDYNLYDGITISRNLVINGNNHVIDGKKIAKIFKVTNAEVFFINLTFLNGNSNTNGGAISGLCLVDNCRFIGNHAGDNGGALSDGVTVYSSTFEDNSANGKGGAIYDGYAYDCVFERNKAVLYFNSHGGAIYSGYAENCRFVNNTASWGGAMYGDMYMGNLDAAVKCTFIGNSATYNGGALYDFGAINSTFIKNSAGENGGAMYGFAALNCTFYDNTAKRGNNTYDTEFLDANITVSNFTSYYGSGESLKVTLINDEGSVVNDGIITANVYKDGKIVGTYDFITGKGWIVDLDAGTYQAVLGIEHQSYNLEPVNITLNINKLPTMISAAPITTTYNMNKDLIITLKDAKGKPISGAQLSVNFNGVKRLTTDKNGQIKVSTKGLVAKNYNVQITFEGNNNLIKSSVASKVIIKKANAKLTAKAKTFKAKVKSKKYSVTLKDNMGKAMKNVKLTLKIKGKTFKATTNAKGKATFNIKKFNKKGKHTIQIVFKGNNCFNSLNKKVKIKIK